MDILKIKSVISAFHFESQIQPVSLELPIVFQRRYEFLTLTVQNSTFLLIKEKRSGSLENFIKQVQAIQKQVEKEVILVFNKLTDEQKKQLLQVGVSYLDYQENVFIPQLGFLFSKTPPKFKTDNQLTSTEQKLLITLLLHTKGLIIDMEGISQLTHLSVPSLYRHFRSLRERGWLHNKHKSYQFAKPKSVIFNESKPLLDNPIKEVTIIIDKDFQKIKNEVSFKMTHYQALSYLGMLADSDNYGHYAISKKQYKSFKATLQQHVLQGHRLEIWTYEPVPFDYTKNKWFGNTNMPLVDPISLYLTLRNDEDPRIEEEVELLEDKILDFLGE
ncbi:Uncharacterised protein [Streptococcus dysgalactiae subsp. dysgalactiae]|uniref:Transcriptional regulator n=1 Tax=Streptococcus dysgalactiae subsp. dysgalactiae TaxID=99822 RepID=A0A380JU80_STRDY|nr:MULTISPECIES: hypothetical protein [Streptococcus]EFY02715.1 hypothetical protein SDD27957_05330 [Streptococcus dysgalactiae subsp. dysgalactiae ATCC 27957]MCB2835614.1 hypothetical protein [Streptococcus dysgalactiae subsp. dysgalactiae]SUN49119.1 Uncharacterised protein [Streptococcus dysgalactiae subsp. dysgalactiae]HEO4332718.1 hypothetical protein [Streptococcus agalactiae]HEO7335815.1 hypothetical protein [Streptococcus agalactiae]